MAKTLTFANLFIPDEGFGWDIILGIAAALIFIGINLATAGNVTIGIPTWFTTVGERWSIVVGLAPFVEELVFRVFFFWAMLTIFPLVIGFLTKNRVKGEGVGVLASFIIIPIAFSLFHATAYASSFSAQNITATIGLFIGAWMFGLIATLLVFTRKNFYSSWVMHAIVNAFIMTQLFVIVA